VTGLGVARCKAMEVLQRSFLDTLRTWIRGLQRSSRAPPETLVYSTFSKLKPHTTNIIKTTMLPFLLPCFSARNDSVATGCSNKDEPKERKQTGTARPLHGRRRAGPHRRRDGLSWRRGVGGGSVPVRLGPPGSRWRRGGPSLRRLGAPRLLRAPRQLRSPGGAFWRAPGLRCSPGLSGRAGFDRGGLRRCPAGLFGGRRGRDESRFGGAPRRWCGGCRDFGRRAGPGLLTLSTSVAVSAWRAVALWLAYGSCNLAISTTVGQDAGSECNSEECGESHVV